MLGEGINSYERKVRLMVEVAIRRFGGTCSDEQMLLERRAAENVLARLGVRP